MYIASKELIIGVIMYLDSADHLFKHWFKKRAEHDAIWFDTGGLFEGVAGDGIGHPQNK